MDTRSLRSRELLRNALSRSLKTLPFEHITVVFLTKRAGVNRSTFYQHYATTDDLLIDLVAHSLDTTGFTEIDPFELDITEEAPPPFVFKLMDFIEEAREVYAKQLPLSARNNLCVQFLSHLCEIFDNIMISRSPEPPARLNNIYPATLAGALSGTLWAWMQSDGKQSRTETTTWIWYVIRLSLINHQYFHYGIVTAPELLPKLPQLSAPLTPVTHSPDLQ